MIGGFNNGTFDLKSPIAKIKLCQIKALYSVSYCFLPYLTGHFSFSHLVAKLKAEATRIEMEAELTCQTKVSYSVNNPVLL